LEARLFVAGLVETDESPPSLSAGLFRRVPLVLMTFVVGFSWNSSSSPLVAGVSTVEPALLLGKGYEETLVEAVEVSICSAAVFA